jgi:type I restriction enzyme S subunit
MIDTDALREKVLDLAIRGKLVPQDPNDEPASVLLERIRAEKQQMVKDGKLKLKDIKNDTIIFKGDDNLHYEKFNDGTVKCIEDEIPFELPQGWEWSRFSSAFIINPRNDISDDLQVSFIPMPLIKEGYSNNHSQEIKSWKEVKKGFTHFAENDVAVAKITPCFENKKSVVFNNLTNGYGAGTTELHIIRALENTVYPEYILWNIKIDSFINNGIKAFSGAVGQKKNRKRIYCSISYTYTTKKRTKGNIKKN